MTFRQEKLNVQLTKIIAEFLRNEFGASPLISVIHVLIAHGLREARVRIAVFPEKEEKRVLSLLRKKRAELNRYLALHTKMKYLPSVTFEIDSGEKNRKRIEELLQ
mgnify:CR=1 FL=1